MNPDNIWLQQKVLRKAAKLIAKDFFPKPARKDIYSTCMDLGQDILASYDKEKHGAMWPWIFLNMLSKMDGSMCASMILIVCQSQIPWQRDLAIQCLVEQRQRAKLSKATRDRASSTPATSSVRSSRSRKLPSSSTPMAL
jgi:hypothetical protein